MVIGYANEVCFINVLRLEARVGNSWTQYCYSRLFGNWQGSEVVKNDQCSISAVLGKSCLKLLQAEEELHSPATTRDIQALDWDL